MTATVPAAARRSASSWQTLEGKLAVTQARVRELEFSADRRNSFMAYTPETDSAYVDLEGRRLLMMSGYSYLGLAGDPRVAEAAKAAIDSYGTGAHGVRALAGTTPLHHQLEATVAALVEREAALVFSSGYACNVGTIAGLCGPGDAIFVDKFDHASIIDGCQLSGASVTRFRHNDPDHLAHRLSHAPGRGMRIVIVDSVYSMDGDIAPLPDLREVCDAHDALLMVDEAHALGVIGPTGRGIEEHFGHQVLVDVKVGTLSKAIPSIGGWVAGPRQMIDHLKYAARPFLFSAALPPAQAGAALAALQILTAEPQRVSHVQQQAERLRTILTSAGMRTGHSESAVIPLIAGSDQRAYDYATACRHHGVVGLPVVSPAVPNTLARLRIAITARHSVADIDLAAEAFLLAADGCGLLER